MSAATPGSYVLNFGKYRGQGLTAIAESDEGLLYLDWFVGECRDRNMGAILKAFLKGPALQRRLDVPLEGR